MVWVEGILAVNEAEVRCYRCLLPNGINPHVDVPAVVRGSEHAAYSNRSRVVFPQSQASFPITDKRPRRPHEQTFFQRTESEEVDVQMVESATQHAESSLLLVDRLFALYLRKNVESHCACAV